MSRRAKVFIGLVAALAILVGVVWVQLQQAAQFDQEYQQLVIDIRQRIDEVARQRDQTGEFFSWLDTDARQRLEALPEPRERFQTILRERLKAMIDGLVEAHQTNPLHAESMDFLNEAAIELEDMLGSLREATGYQPTY